MAACLLRFVFVSCLFYTCAKLYFNGIPREISLWLKKKSVLLSWSLSFFTIFFCRCCCYFCFFFCIIYGSLWLYFSGTANDFRPSERLNLQYFHEVRVVLLSCLSLYFDFYLFLLLVLYVNSIYRCIMLLYFILFICINKYIF